MFPGIALDRYTVHRPASARGASWALAALPRKNARNPTARPLTPENAKVHRHLKSTLEAGGDFLGNGRG